MKYDGKNLEEVLKHHSLWVRYKLDPNDRADFSYGILTGANLSDRDLSEASFVGAMLNHADLRYSAFHYCDFADADLSDAALAHASFSKARNLPYIPLVCPDTGEFIGWKQCWYMNGPELCHAIVKLLIPEDALRSSGTTRKCRASKAIVLDIQDEEGHSLPESINAHSIFNSYFLYKVGQTVEPQLPFETDRWLSCASGIHFFINRQEAVDYEA